MTYLILSWLISALALWIVARVVPGIELRDFKTALLATVVIALVNGTIGTVLKFLTFPITILTLGLSLLVINALLLKVSSGLVPGFNVRGFWNAVLGSLALTVMTSILRYVLSY